MQNGVNSNSREGEKRIILKMNFQGRVIVPLFLMFLEEAKPILAGAENADYVAQVNNFQKVLFWSHFYQKVWQIFLNSSKVHKVWLDYKIFKNRSLFFEITCLVTSKQSGRFFSNFCGLLKIPEF